ncbi:MAG: PQ-loop domain-containing transporter [Polyangiaceae bacterium]
MRELLGWISSLILLATIVQQIRTQVKERSTRGVSRWLFVGQTAASVGFTVYSFLVGNWVFTATNALLLLAGLTGWLITWGHARGLRLSRSARPSTKVADT